MRSMDPEWWRRSLVGVFLLGIAGTATELVLLEHFEDWRQWIPLALLAAGFVTAVAVWRRGGRAEVRAMRWSSVAFVISGFVGVYFHIESNLEFELERDAALRGIPLAWEALTGALPALAPGAMMLLGLIGLVITAGHPALEPEGRTDATH